jgi:hypothetical protein
MPDSAFKSVRLDLARTPAFPEGSGRHFYRFIAPLDADGHLDAAAWKRSRDRCRVVRSWGGKDEEIGYLVHRPGGAWWFDNDSAGSEGDEGGYRLGGHRLAIGEYVSIREANGVMNTFRVGSITDA